MNDTTSKSDDIVSAQVLRQQRAEMLVQKICEAYVVPFLKKMGANLTVKTDPNGISAIAAKIDASEKELAEPIFQAVLEEALVPYGICVEMEESRFTFRLKE